MSTALIWFRNNLRLHDNKALQLAQKHARIIPFYVFDPRQFGETSFGFPKTGALRFNFLRETVVGLRSNLQAIGSNLVVRSGKSEEVLPNFCSEYNVDTVFAEREVAPEEQQVQQAVEDAVSAEVEYVWGNSLYHIDDLPIAVDEIPDVFTQFRKKLEKESQVRDYIPKPQQLPDPEIADAGDIPGHSDFGLPEASIDDRAVIDFEGGEAAALQRLDHYFWESDQLKSYKWTRNGLLGADFSSKFSPWLANGSLSPRKIHQQVKEYEEERKQNVSTYWMIFELIWRDFFRFSALKHGSSFFKPGGIQQKNRKWRQDRDDFQKWADGRTGIPFIDANMRELNQTGYMSNRGRQNVASFLSQNLNIDWRMGAEYFESKLLDYDVYSNYGNWMYNSTVGHDPRNRYFNILNQADKYDEKGEYVRHWLPELKNVPKEYIHKPHEMPEDQQKLAGVVIGEDYPKPMIDLEKSYEEIRNRE